jgi:hypothetical protein
MSNHHRNTRAWRRHDTARLRNARAGHYQMRWRCFETPESRQRVLGMLVHTAKACSCPMCGNPRRFFNNALTLAEKRHLDEAKAGWDELASND